MQADLREIWQGENDLGIDVQFTGVMIIDRACKTIGCFD